MLSITGDQRDTNQSYNEIPFIHTSMARIKKSTLLIKKKKLGGGLLHHTACKILVPQPGIEPGPSASESTES